MGRIRRPIEVIPVCELQVEDLRTILAPSDAEISVRCDLHFFPVGWSEQLGEDGHDVLNRLAEGHHT